MKVMLVRYEKFVSTMTCEFEWEEVDDSASFELATQKLGGNPTGGVGADMNGSRVVMLSRGNVMVEIWERPESFDPELEERVINGWTYQRKERVLS